MEEREIVKKVEKYIKNQSYNESSGHDWWHIKRVYNLAIKLNEKEEKIKKIKEDNPNIDELITDKKDVPLNKEQKEKIADLVNLITDKDMIELSEALKISMN